MKVYDDIFSWEGWGGPLKLGSGKCKLRIFDLSRRKIGKGLTHLRPIIVMASDIPESRMSIRSCAGHIATRVTQFFRINHDRMMYIEYYPALRYGENQERFIPERYEVVDFIWYDDKAIKPVWRNLNPPLLDTIKELLEV